MRRFGKWIGLVAIILKFEMVYGQTYPFVSTCGVAAGDSIVEDAFAKQCVSGWTAASGKPSILVSSHSIEAALLRNGEGIRLGHLFDYCDFQHFQLKVKLSPFGTGQLTLLFANEKGESYKRSFALQPNTEWTTMYCHSLALPATFEHLTVSFIGNNSSLLIDDVFISDTCIQNLAINSVPSILGDASSEGTLTLSDSQIKFGDAFSLVSSEHIIIHNEVIFKEGSEVTLRIVPCKEDNCYTEPPKPPVELVVYNLLSPNGDGQNDTFYIQGLEDYAEAELAIVNKAGQVVYHVYGYKNDWTGGEEPKGVYNYQIRLQKGEKPLTGELLIVR